MESRVSMGIYIFFSSFLVLMSAIEVLLFLTSGGSSSSVLVLEFDWSFFGGFCCCTPVVVDWSSVIFSASVLSIAGGVMLFSCFYMDHEVFPIRFCYLVVLFVLFMNLLIFMPSILGMMVGWDGLGVVSFLLVVYYGNSESLGAGVITALSNRVGDALFIVLISLSVASMSWHFFDLNSVWPSYLVGLLVLASMTKSAQVPFSAWLPAAMAAPTPVSALVHSSTLVTAGVYVLFRFHMCIQGAWGGLLGGVAMMTLILAGLSASVENDMKKIVAFSTLSQLGMMMLALSLDLKNVCFFHLITHAFFKALMFLCVGAIIYMGAGLQDLRLFGSLWSKMPNVCSWLVVSCMSLVGVPFMAGFYSKDLIVEGLVFNGSSFFMGATMFFSVFLTAFYSTRFFLCAGIQRGWVSMESYSDCNVFLLMSLFMLGSGAIFAGVVLQGSVLMLNSFVWVPGSLKVLTLSCIVGGVLASLTVEKFLHFRSLSGTPTQPKNFFGLMMFLPILTGQVTSGAVLSVSLETSLFLEKGWVESFVMKNVMWSAQSQGKAVISFLQSGRGMGWVLFGVLGAALWAVFFWGCIT
uniref:NADH dehydrogenase subunit 5 n=1 Tax=Xylonora corona TaxID=2939326 RepID=UPI002027F270|nr:NADH dehydrogenase subunit 5 [Xylonora corona]UPX88872.1 NADH dehydrogenase subunit 5 [Xylonora corona]